MPAILIRPSRPLVSIGLVAPWDINTMQLEVALIRVPGTLPIREGIAPTTAWVALGGVIVRRVSMSRLGVS